MRKATLLGFTVAVVAALVGCCEARHPVVGVLTKPVDERDPSKGSFVGATIVRYIESGGLRVVPLLYDLNATAADALLDKLNGVVFTGGGVTLKRGTPYVATAQRAFDRASHTAPGAAPFPIFGVCLGFELSCILAADDESVLTVDKFDAEGLPLPLELTGDAQGSAMLGDAPAPLLTAFVTRNMTLNDHVCGVLPETYRSNARLSKFFRVLSTNRDRKGLEFISTIESRDQASTAVYATQWHPECNSQLWIDSLGTDHSPDAVWGAAWILRPFVRAAQANTNSFPSEAEEVAALIDQYPTKSDFTDGTQPWYFPTSQ